MRTEELFAGTPDETTPEERALENDIALAAMRLATSQTHHQRRHWYAELKRLHGQRQTHTIERLERKQGLRP